MATNAVEHFQRALIGMSEEHLNDLLTIEVKGPHKPAAFIITAELRRMVRTEVEWRRVA